MSIFLLFLYLGTMFGIGIYLLYVEKKVYRLRKCLKEYQCVKCGSFSVTLRCIDCEHRWVLLEKDKG